jgi:succinate dehydrogenase/fumarate reductase flavoprotein subunit
MRRMRRQVRRSGVRILDHHPALELLVASDGSVAGAAGVARQDDGARWEVRAGAVVLATGGCAFLSGAFGLNVDTGDGHLMAAEAGADLSGMEFSNAYALSPAYGSHTKGLMLQFASYFGEDGTRLDLPGFAAARPELARRVAAGETVYIQLDKAPPELRAPARSAQPNYFLPLDKAGIDPFTERYPARFVLEGTVRGTGGLRVVADDCSTGVPGLYAAGDVATRELVTGAISGGGSYNAAWAIASGTWAGAAAARFGVPRLPGAARPAGRAGMRPSGGGAVDAAEVVATVQDEVVPLERNFFRTRDGLVSSLSTLDQLWAAVSAGLAGTGRAAVRAREAAAMVAHARWMYRAALARDESRGMHRRDDAPDTRPDLQHRIVTGGLDDVWTRPLEVPVS